MSTARRSTSAQPSIWPGDHAGRPLVVEVRTLPPLTLRAPAPEPAPVVVPLPVDEPVAVATGHENTYETGYEGLHAPVEPREPTFDELVHGYGRHRSSGPSRAPRRAAGRRA